jgi:hypothetical protein
MGEPVDKELYSRVKQMASDKFSSPTGIFRSAWIVKKYKQMGGKYTNTNKPSKIQRWMREGWIDLNQPNGKGGYYPCGHKNTQNDKYPLCRPSKTISKDTPEKYQNISSDRIKRANVQKQKIKGSGNIRF